VQGRNTSEAKMEVTLIKRERILTRGGKGVVIGGNVVGKDSLSFQTERNAGKKRNVEGHLRMGASLFREGKHRALKKGERSGQKTSSFGKKPPP